MEVKINKDIREFRESIFFGLTMRQFIFSICACVVAIVLYFLLKPFFGIETLSWVCILGATPFAVLGFITYNGMTAEKFIFAFIKSQFLIPKKIGLINKEYSENFNKKLMKAIYKPEYLEKIQQIEKERRKKDENIK